LPRVAYLNFPCAQILNLSSPPFVRCEKLRAQKMLPKKTTFLEKIKDSHHLTLDRGHLATKLEVDEDVVCNDLGNDSVSYSLRCDSADRKTDPTSGRSWSYLP